MRYIRIFRRKVEDTTGFSRLGSVEPAAERARELAVHIQAVRVIRVLSHNRCLGTGERVRVNGTFKRGQASQGRGDLGLGEVRHQACSSVHQRNVPVAILILSLHCSSPVATVSGITVVRHISAGQPIAYTLDKADAEIGEFLQTALRRCPESSPHAEVDVLVLSCIGKGGPYLNPKGVGGAVCDGIRSFSRDIDVGVRVGGAGGAMSRPMLKSAR